MFVRPALHRTRDIVLADAAAAGALDAKRRGAWSLAADRFAVVAPVYLRAGRLATSEKCRALAAECRALAAAGGAPRARAQELLPATS